MFARINNRVRKVLFFAAAIGVYAFILPQEVRQMIGAFAVGWCLYAIADSWFPRG
jgi:hypothetical protein